jgi:2-methylcitrate dehydratase PrpD
VAIFPALLAIGEHAGSTGRDLLEAYVVGCEVGLALQHTTKYKQMDKGFHSTAVIGRLACTAACAKLLNLDAHQTTTALGMAGSMASGLIHNFGTMTKPLHARLTGRDGVTAVQLAQLGLTAGDQVVEHPFGFAATVLGEGIYNLDDMADNLGKPFRTQDALIIKKYPCCGSNHAMLDSLFSLMRDNDFGVDDVANAEIDQSYYSVVMLYQEPEDEQKGKFSAKYNVAAALVDGKVKVDTFTQEKIGDPVINEAMDKVQTRVMAKSEELQTEAANGLKVKITLKDGRVFEHMTARADILGSQKNSWGFDAIKSKFRENVALVLNDEGINDAVAAWSDIPDVTNVAELVRSTLVTNKT